jgi:hypothetical protein
MERELEVWARAKRSLALGLGQARVLELEPTWWRSPGAGPALGRVVVELAREELVQEE